IPFHPLCYSNVTPSQGHLRSPEDTRTGTSRKARSGRGHTDARGGGRGVGEGTVILLLILAAGLLGGNELVSVSAAVLLLLRASGWGHAFRFLAEHGWDLGVIFLLLGRLLPLGPGRLGPAAPAASLAKPAGLIAVAVGTLAAYLAAQGVA